MFRFPGGQLWSFFRGNVFLHHFLTSAASTTDEQSEIKQCTFGCRTLHQVLPLGKSLSSKAPASRRRGETGLSKVAMDGNAGAWGSSCNCYTCSCRELTAPRRVIWMGRGRPGRAPSFAHPVVSSVDLDSKDIPVTYHSARVGLGDVQGCRLFCLKPQNGPARRGWASRWGQGKRGALSGSQNQQGFQEHRWRAGQHDSTVSCNQGLRWWKARGRRWLMDSLLLECGLHAMGHKELCKFPSPIGKNKHNRV